MLACQISRKSWARQDQLCHLAFIFGPTSLNFKIDYIQNFFIQNSKMTKIKHWEEIGLTTIIIMV